MCGKRPEELAISRLCFSSLESGINSQIHMFAGLVSYLAQGTYNDLEAQDRGGFKSSRVNRCIAEFLS